MACLPFACLVLPFPALPSPAGCSQAYSTEEADSRLGSSLCQQPKETQQVHSLRIPV